MSNEKEERYKEKVIDIISRHRDPARRRKVIDNAFAMGLDDLRTDTIEMSNLLVEMNNEFSRDQKIIKRIIRTAKFRLKKEKEEAEAMSCLGEGEG